MSFSSHLGYTFSTGDRTINIECLPTRQWTPTLTATCDGINLLNVAQLILNIFSFTTPHASSGYQTLSVSAIDCGVPPPVTGATASHPYGTLFGNEAVYTCTGNLVFGGVNGETEMTATCQESGEWTSVDVQCIGIEKSYNIKLSG